MKIRSYLKNKKTTNHFIPKSTSAYKTNSKTKLKHITSNQTNLTKQLSCEQKAYHTLIEQSWNNDVFKNFQKHQPDAFLKITPRLKQREKEYRDSINKHQKANITDLKILDYTNNQKEQRKNRTQQSLSHSQRNKHRVFINPDNTRNISNVNNHLFVGKEVLCLTQYMISGPQMSINSVDYPRKLQRSKYIRVLKQMKNRSYRKNQDKNHKFDQITQNKIQIYETKSPKKLQTFFTMPGTTTAGLQKIFISSQKVKKQQNTQSLRTTFHKNYKLDINFNYSNRFK